VSRVECAKRKAEDIYYWASSGCRKSGGRIWALCKDLDMLEEVVECVEGNCVNGRQERVGPLTKTIALFKKTKEATFELIDVKILPVGPTTKFVDKLKGATEKWIKGI